MFLSKVIGFYFEIEGFFKVSGMGFLELEYELQLCLVINYYVDFNIIFNL